MNVLLHSPSNHRPQALIEQARRGDPRALAELIRRHRPQLERVARRMCRSEDNVDDILQEAYLAILRNISSFRGESSFLTWAYTIIRTARGRHIRRDLSIGRRESSLELLPPSVRASLADPNRGPDDAVAGHELGHTMSQALGQLSDVDRKVLLLRDLEGYTATEVAQRLGLSVPAVKTRLHRARVAVRSELSEVLAEAA